MPQSFLLGEDKPPLPFFLPQNMAPGAFCSFLLIPFSSPQTSSLLPCFLQASKDCSTYRSLCAVCRSRHKQSITLRHCTVCLHHCIRRRTLFSSFFSIVISVAKWTVKTRQFGGEKHTFSDDAVKCSEQLSFFFLFSTISKHWVGHLMLAPAVLSGQF